MAPSARSRERIRRAGASRDDGRWEHWQQLPIRPTSSPSTALHGRGMKTALALILLMMTTTGCVLPLRLLRTLTATPNPDTTPYPKTILRGLVPGQRIDWIGNDTLVFIGWGTKEDPASSLYAWDLKSPPQRLYKGVESFCVNGNSIMLGTRAPTARLSKHYRIRFPDRKVEYLGSRELAKGFSYGSNYTCQNYPTPPPLLRHNWVELKPGDGFLDFGVDGSQRGYSVSRLEEKLEQRHDTGIKVDLPTLPAITDWHPEKGYLIYDINLSPEERRRWQRTNSLTIWHLDSEQVGHAVKVPAGPWVNTHRGDILFLKARNGLVITTKGFNPDGSPGTAGAYLLQPDGRYQRLETGFVSEAAMSADGCRLAYALEEYLDSRPREGERILVVVNLCAKQ